MPSRLLAAPPPLAGGLVSMNVKLSIKYQQLSLATWLPGRLPGLPVHLSACLVSTSINLVFVHFDCYVKTEMK